MNEWIVVTYLACVVYCMWRTVIRYKQSSHDGVTGYTPGLDLIVMIILAPVFAPVDIIIRIVKKIKNAIHDTKAQDKT